MNPSDRHLYIAFAVMTIVFVLAPTVIYPLFLMKALCSRFSRARSTC
jgi:hypothetical protein